MLNTALGGRIYEIQAPPNAELPLLVFSIVSDQPLRHFGKTTWSAQVHFDLFVSRDVGMAAANGAGTIEEFLFAALENASLTVTGQDRGLILTTQRGPRQIDEDAIRISLDAEIVGTTT